MTVRQDSILYIEANGRSVATLCIDDPVSGGEVRTSQIVSINVDEEEEGPTGERLMQLLAHAHLISDTPELRSATLSSYDETQIPLALGIGSADELDFTERIEIVISEDSDGDWYLGAQRYHSGGKPRDGKRFYLGPAGDAHLLSRKFREALAWARQKCTP